LHFLIGDRLHLALAARPDRDAAAREPLAGNGACRAARRSVQPPRGAHGRRPAQQRRRRAADAEARLDRWIDANRPLVERCLGILGDIRAGGTYDLTTLPVALRELRNLIEAAAALAAVG